MKEYVARLAALSVFAVIAEQVSGDGKLRSCVRILTGLLALGVVMEAVAALRAFLTDAGG